MGKVWLTADLHFGHANIIEYCRRPFASVAEMDSCLISRWNALVGAEDLVYVLGDFAKDPLHGLTLLKSLAGCKILVAGNHDACHPRWEGADDARERYLAAGWSAIHAQLQWDCEGRRVLLHHYPFAGNRAFPERDPEEGLHMPRDDGEWLLHGHVHDLWKTRERMINVGVDVWNFEPVSWETIRALILEPTRL